MTFLQTHRARVAAYSILLFLLDVYLYFWNFGHFFQGDSVFLLNRRPTSISGLLHAFIATNPSGWYRPLSHTVLEFILYPVLGLHPVGYRMPVYALFMAITAGVYWLASAVTRNRLAAAIAAFYFNIHTTNAFTTYDIGFMPELLFTAFYIASVLAYLRYAETGSKWALRCSIAFFVGSLLSKEAGFTLPVTLIAIHFLMGLKSPLRATSVHFLIMFLFVALAVGYLGVEGVSIAKFFKPPVNPDPGSYNFALSRGLLVNADYATSWAFNIPRGWSTGFRHLSDTQITLLKGFRLATLLFLGIILLQPERNVLLLGIAWFLITLLPALPLIDHFMPHYLFLPTVGFSVVIGTVVAFVYKKLRAMRFLAPATVALFFAPVLYVCSISIHGDMQNHPLLGVSADAALRSLDDLKAQYPTLPPNALLYINDDQYPLWWHQDSGGLVRMAYNRSDIKVVYSSLGENLPSVNDSESLIRLDLKNNHLTAYRKPTETGQ